jgi:hypothetical protein
MTTQTLVTKMMAGNANDIFNGCDCRSVIEYLINYYGNLLNESAARELIALQELNKLKQ